MHGSGAIRVQRIGKGHRWRVRTLVLVGLLVLIVVAVVGAASPVSAHPLGNFTTNRYARVEVSAGVVRIYYVLDEAELRAFERREVLKQDREGFVAQQVASIQRGLRLSISGRPLDLVAAPARLDLLPGQAGLDTLRLAVVFSAAAPPSGPEPVEATFEDANEPERLGWREVVVVARSDATLEQSTAPAKDASDELRDYPSDLLQAPLNQREAAFTFRPGTRPVGAEVLTPPATAASRAGDELTRLIERQRITVPALAAVLGLAFLFGSAHALGPGHGKTVMAAYLVGTSGRTVDAVLLGVIVSLMHTGSVLGLGLLLLQLDRFGAIERIYPALSVVSGVAVVAFAGLLLARRVRALRTTRPHDHDHEHDHDHDHDHGPGGHTHDLPEGTAPLSRRGLVLLATSGGLLPSPSAVLVVVAGFAAGRIALGLSIVLAFSVGLAATLSAVGTALVLGRRVIERRVGGAVVRVLPVGGAVALMAVGLFLATAGLVELR